MKKAIKFLSRFVDAKLDLRVRLFNVVAMAGTLISALIGISCIFTNAGWANIIINFATAVLAFSLLVYAYKSGRYQLCYLITIAVVFFVAFPAVFITGGGYKSGMPSFFIFAVVFTFFMLEGKKAFIISATLLLVYSGLCLFAYLRPEALNYFPAEQDVMADTIIGFVTVSIAIGLTMYFQLKLYNDQQKILAEQNAALDRLNQLKTEFLSNVSHELKTPLTVMSVIAQQSKSGLSEYPELAEMSEQMRVIAAESDRLGLMVTQVLDMTRIEEGRMVIAPRPSNISEIIQTTMSTYYPLLKKNGNRLVLTPCDELPDVYADPDRVSQVLVNILQNAIRHTNGGTITVSAELSGAYIAVTVKDTGEGIEAERLLLLFERFKSRDSKKERKTKDTGTGLGLYICKHIIETHGGVIGVESEVGIGTRVWFTIPIN